MSSLMKVFWRDKKPLLKEILEKCWQKDTCYPGMVSRWNKKIPEIGQCAVTALLVQELIGGIIVKNHKLNHYFNIVDNKVIDLTKEQFLEEDYTNDYDEIVHRQDLVNVFSRNEIRPTNTWKRYGILHKRFTDLLFKKPA